MLAFDLIAEQRIAEAISRDEFDDLPGQGRPLALDDDPLVPEDLRIAYRILKNAGFENPLQDSNDRAARAKAVRKLALLNTRIESAYYEKALNRLAR